MPDFLGYYANRAPGLTKDGGDYRARCPIHQGKTVTSFAVDPKTWRWFCHACEEGGDPYRLEERLSPGMSFPEIKRVVDELVGSVTLDQAVGGAPTPSSPRSRSSSSREPAAFGRIVATYDYRLADGSLYYQVCRMEPKNFRQRRPDPNGRDGWTWKVAGLERILYRLPEVLATPGPVYIAEGEKDVEALVALGFNATCNSGGAGKFNAGMAKAIAGRRVYIFPDNDEPNHKGVRPGRKHADEVAALCTLEGCEVYIVAYPAKDPADWIADGATLEQVEAAVEGAAAWGKKAPELDELDGELDQVAGSLPANVHDMLRNYIILVGSQMIWDERRACTVLASDLKLAHAADYPVWVKDPEARKIDLERLVFKPQGAEPGEINIFRGLTMTPRPEASCARLVEHLAMLCGGDAELIHWVTAWLAYPLQNLGAKMATSLVAHGAQGTGKSILFETVRRIYGDYGGIIGQTQISSPYTAWASRKLFVLADEVLTRSEAREVKNRLKSLITGDELVIEEKYKPARVEQNSMNLVFLSNEDTPLVIEQGDRRFTVLRCDQVQAPGYYAALADEIREGGAEAFMAYLMAYDLKGFNAHTKPIANIAKEEIIEASASPVDRFLDAWERGELPVPVGGVYAADLFEAYRVWSASSGERFGLGTQTAFGRTAGKRYPKRQARRAGAIVWLYQTGDNNDAVGEAETFKKRLDGWLETVQERRL